MEAEAVAAPVGTATRTPIEDYAKIPGSTTTKTKQQQHYHAPPTVTLYSSE